jgi:hypothetical protein
MGLRRATLAAAILNLIGLLIASARFLFLLRTGQLQLMDAWLLTHFLPHASIVWFFFALYARQRG